MLALVKAVGSAWVGSTCFVVAFLTSLFLDKITPPLDKTKSRFRIFMEVLIQFGVVGAVVFVTRHMIKNVPFPADGLSGYKHSENGELRSLPLFVFIFMFFQKKMQAKMTYLST